MDAGGPIIIVEDDENDSEVIATAIRDIGVENEIRIMDSTWKAYEYLLTTKDRPIFILCDIRMPVTDGLSRRKMIQENPVLRTKSIPFVFLTGMVSQSIIDIAYGFDVQGFFQKPASCHGLKEQLLSLLVY